MKDLNKLKKAGKIAAEVREESKGLIREGEDILKVAELIERWILEKGGQLAFPVNISLNEEAAHATPSHDDKRIMQEKDVVTVDIGVHVDGFVGGDTAYTIDLSGNRQKLVDASEEALENALPKVRAGAKAREIGRAIGDTIKKHGYKPVENLTGHGLGLYEIHTPPAIPNIDDGSNVTLHEGQIIAIEPFASTGTGRVREGMMTEIFSYSKPVLTRNMDARKLSELIKNEYNTLPFAERWLYRMMPELKLKMALRELVMRKGLHAYPVLKDVDGSFVSQTEVSMIVEKDGCRLLTPWKRK